MAKVLTPTKAAEELLRRKKAQDSLLAFTEYTHPRWETSDHHYKVCKRLEQLERLDECEFCGNPVAKLATFAPPRHGKTELASRRFPAWCFGRHPEWQMICAQATGQLAADTGADVRDILKSTEYKNVFPDVSLREDAQAAGRWLTQEGGVYFAAGVDGAIVGRGANVLNVDDPHRGRQDADSPRMRDIAGNWYFGDAITRLMPPARELLTLTRWHEDDLAGRVLPPEAEWRETDDPTFYCCDNGWHVLRMRAIENEGSGTERALWPGRYPLSRLHEIRTAMRDAGRTREWGSQYQQRPVAEEGSYFLREWFETRYDELPKDCLMYAVTDFAVTKQTKNNDPDRTEIGVVALAPDDRAYVVDWVSVVDTPDVWVDRLADLVSHYCIPVVFGEAGVIRRAVEPYIKRAFDERGVNVWLEWMPTTADKKARARSMQAWCATNRVVFPKRAPWASGMIDELASFGGGGRYDDKVDAMAHFFLAIDQNHPAIVRSQRTTDKVRDRWSVIDGGQGKNWRLGRTG